MLKQYVQNLFHAPPACIIYIPERSPELRERNIRNKTYLLFQTVRPFGNDKRERENILRAVGIKVEPGDRIDYGESKGTFKTVGDEEHVKIVDLYLEGRSMGKVAKELDRSRATVHSQIHSHNQAIERQGFCARCRRMKGAHDVQKATRTTL